VWGVWAVELRVLTCRDAACAHLSRRCVRSPYAGGGVWARHTAATMTAPRSGPFSRLPCNTWTWCGRDVCWEPDAHTHTRGDCWLKFAELPEVWSSFTCTGIAYPG